MYVSASGSAAPDVRLVGLALSGNSATGEASGLGNGGAVLVRGSRLAVLCGFLSGNRARADGGACWLSLGGLVVASSSFSNCSAGGSGGALLVEDSPSNLTVTLSSFAANVAANGGGISLRSCSGAVLLSGVVLDGNAALQGSGGGASVLYASGALRLELCRLSNNRAWMDGSALYLSTVLEAAQDPKFIPSWVQLGYVETELPSGNDVPYAIRNCTVASNSAANGNGAIALSGMARMVLDATSFTKNQARSGGAFFCRQNSSANLSSVLFQSNSADYGGAVHAQDSCLIGLAGSELVSNSAGVCGGALSLNSTNPVTASGLVHITLNSADRSGGGVCVLVRETAQSPLCHSRAGVHPVMFSLRPNALVRIELNSAKGQGGAIYFSCVTPGSAALQVWSSQNLTLSPPSSSRRGLPGIDRPSRLEELEPASRSADPHGTDDEILNALSDCLLPLLRSLTSNHTASAAERSIRGDGRSILGKVLFAVHCRFSCT